MLSQTMQSHKTMIHAVSAMLLLAAAAAAQPCNTGYKPGNCGTLYTHYNPETGGNKIDAHWQLAAPYPSAPSNLATGTTEQRRLIEDPCAAKFGDAWIDIPDGQGPVVFGYWSSENNTSASDWITPYNEVNEPGGLYIYKVSFTTAPNWVSGNTISGRLQSDNETYSIYGLSSAQKCQHLAGYQYNGTTFSGSAINGPAAFQTWTPFTTGPFTAPPSSPAELYFIVRNRGVGGIDANDTPTGLRVEFGTFNGTNLGQSGSGDFNGDGQTDVAVVDNGTNSVAIFESQDGSFPTATEYAAGQNPCCVAVADFNGDGKPDVAVANYGASSVSIMLNNGTGGLDKPVTYKVPANPTGIAFADFNHDGILDLVVINGELGSYTILLGTGGGKFEVGKSVVVAESTTASFFTSVVAADFNADGNPDLAIADGAGDAIILLGEGNGSFTPPVVYPVGTFPDTILSADFNGDGKLDLAMSDPDTGNVYTMQGNGDGTFQPAVAYPAAGGAQGLSILSGDGLLALVVVNPALNMVTYLLSNGDGTFQAPVSNPQAGTPWSLAPVNDTPYGFFAPALAAIEYATSSVSLVLYLNE